MTDKSTLGSEVIKNINKNIDYLFATITVLVYCKSLPLTTTT